MTLLALPAELVEHIATYLPVTDHCNLRLACHGLEACTLRPFLDMHFTERSFLLPCHASMQALVDMSAHPVFAKRLRKIYFYSAFVENVDVIRYSNEAEVPPLCKNPVSSRRGRAAQREARLVQLALPDEQWEYYKTQQWRPLLTAALQNLANTRVSIAVEFGMHGQAGVIQAHGVKCLQRLFGREDCFAWPSHNQLQGAEMLETAIRAECPLTELSIAGPIAPEAFSSRFGFWSGGGLALQSLERLSIDISDLVASRTTGRSEIRRHVKSLLAFLARARGLQHLTLREQYGGWHGEVFIGRFLRLANLRGLRVMLVPHTRVKAEDVGKFADAHEGTLERYGVWFRGSARAMVMYCTPRGPSRLVG